MDPAGALRTADLLMDALGPATQSGSYADRMPDVPGELQWGHPGIAPAGVQVIPETVASPRVAYRWIFPGVPGADSAIRSGELVLDVDPTALSGTLTPRNYSVRRTEGTWTFQGVFRLSAAQDQVTLELSGETPGKVFGMVYEAANGSGPITYNLSGRFVFSNALVGAPRAGVTGFGHARTDSAKLGPLPVSALQSLSFYMLQSTRHGSIRFDGSCARPVGGELELRASEIFVTHLAYVRFGPECDQRTVSH